MAGNITFIRGITPPNPNQFGGQRVVQFGSAAETLRIADIRDFGAVGDGVTDCSPAFLAAMKSFLHPDGSSGGVIQVPFSEHGYRMKDGVPVKRNIWVAGQQPFGFYLGCQIIPDPGITPFTVERYNTPTGTSDSGAGDFSMFSGLQFENLSHKVANWGISTTYSVGDVRRTGTGIGEDWRRHYRCTTAGTSASSGAGPRSLGNDKTLLYQGQTHNFTREQYITGATSGATGIVMSATNSGAAGTLRLTSVYGTFVNGEALTDPLGGAASANGTTSSATIDEQDGTCRWSYIGSGSMLRMRARASVRDCGFYGASGANIHIEAQDLETPGLFANANGWLIDRCTIYAADGHGLFINGSDANAGICQNCDFGGNGSPISDRDFTGTGYNVYDSGFLGSKHSGNQYASGGLGSVFTNCVGGGSTFEACYQEGSGGGYNVADGACMVIGGGLSVAIWKSSAGGESGAVIIGPQGVGNGLGQRVTGYTDEAWRASDHVVLNEQRTNGGNLYICTAAGICANSGGPTGTGAGISDGTAVWTFVHAVTAHGTVVVGSGDPNLPTFFRRQPGADVTVGFPLYERYGTFGGASGVLGNTYGGYDFSGLMHSMNDGQISEWPTHVAAGRALAEEFYIGGCRITYGIGAPARGTWNPGDRVYYKGSACVAGGAEGLVCTTYGTAGSYSGGRTATATGSTTVVISGAAMSTLRIQQDFKVGDKLTINGGTSRVQTVSADGRTLVMGSAVGAGSGLAITFSPPTFKAFGSIAA